MTRLQLTAVCIWPLNRSFERLGGQFILNCFEVLTKLSASIYLHFTLSSKAAKEVNGLNNENYFNLKVFPHLFSRNRWETSYWTRWDFVSRVWAFLCAVMWFLRTLIFSCRGNGVDRYLIILKWGSWFLWDSTNDRFSDISLSSWCAVKDN